jgi:hypothetical protein
MAFFPRNRTAELKAEIARLHDALEQQGRRTTDVEATLSERVLPTLPTAAGPERDTATPVDGDTAPPPAPGIDPAEFERVLHLAADLGARLEAMSKQLSDLDDRVTAVSRELANQLSELGNDIDALANRPEGAGVDEAVLEELRDSQLRLANEQVRYQIAFRSDLARVAEQLRKQPR